MAVEGQPTKHSKLRSPALDTGPRTLGLNSNFKLALKFFSTQEININLSESA